MRICWVGFHQEGLPAFDAVCRTNADVVACFTLNEQESAKRSGWGDYRSLCEQHNVPMFPIRNINDAEVVEQLDSLAPDFLFVIGWSQILHGPALQTARIGAIGAHASLLPHNRGSAPINWSIIRGERETGNSLIWLVEDVDGGAIIDQRAFPITRYDTCATLYEQVARTNSDMILQLIPKLMAGEYPGRIQPKTGAPILPRRRPQDGLVDWNQSAHAVYDFIRALTRPYPGAFSYIDGAKWTIWQVALLPTLMTTGKPGSLLGPVVSPNDDVCGLVVQCASGQLVILEMEDQQGRVLRGRTLSEGTWNDKGLSSESKTSTGYRRAS
jgi:methionyl-tRNA formyltransferase